MNDNRMQIALIQAPFYLTTKIKICKVAQRTQSTCV
jgi:hypothetical protein